MPISISTARGAVAQCRACRECQDQERSLNRGTPFDISTLAFEVAVRLLTVTVSVRSLGESQAPSRPIRPVESYKQSAVGPGMKDRLGLSDVGEMQMADSPGSGR